jgi:hypothetical protein
MYIAKCLVLFAPYSFLLISNKFWMGGMVWGEQCDNVTLPHWGGGGVREQCGKVTLPQCSPPHPPFQRRNLKTQFSQKKTKHSFSIIRNECFVFLCVFREFSSFKFFGPKMALASRLDAILQGPKNSRFSGPNPLPLAHVMYLHASKNYTWGRIIIVVALALAHQISPSSWVLRPLFYNCKAEVV